MDLLTRLLAMLAAIALLGGAPTAGASPWGANYFPNVALTTHTGDTVHFFDDLIDGKIVAINFIYTTCVDSCPLETAQLVRVQRILGDRLGKDVHFYSISIDPANDTPEVLAEYRDRFGARWTFLTGNEADIIKLRRKLGLYVEEIQDGSNNHNVNMIIGNQATGRWMRRSPFENPYVLADQLGNWLTNWKAPPQGGDYANAPKLRSIPLGEQLFRTRCATCHTVTGKEAEDALGPDLLGVTERREMAWLANWLRAPDRMLAKGDPIATELYERYNRLAMPNMRLNQDEAAALLEYISDETERLAKQPHHHHRSTPARTVTHEHGHTPRNTRAHAPAASGDVVAIMNAWVRATDAKAKANAGYMTLVNGTDRPQTLVAIESAGFEAVEMHEMTHADGMMRMRELDTVTIEPNGTASFAPGGQHLMLLGPRAHLQDGEAVEMTLAFESGARQRVLVAVKAP